jgi:hypothetical protein
MPYTAISTFALDQVYGYQTANKIKDNIEATLAARLEKSFGGSREHSVNVNGNFDVWDYRDLEFDATKLAGLTIRARVEGKVANAATSVTPVIRRVTDAVDHVVGTAITSTSFVEQILTMSPLTAGTKKYRLRGNTSNATHDVWLFGVCESYA